jgi:DNA-binding transcriptional LysR family regulator
MKAAKLSVGIAKLPCFVAEQEPNLVRVSAKKRLDDHFLWMLRHPNTRATSRLRVFSEFIVESISKYKEKLESI